MYNLFFYLINIVLIIKFYLLFEFDFNYYVYIVMNNVFLMIVFLIFFFEFKYRLWFIFCFFVVGVFWFDGYIGDYLLDFLYVIYFCVYTRYMCVFSINI